MRLVASVLVLLAVGCSPESGGLCTGSGYICRGIGEGYQCSGGRWHHFFDGPCSPPPDAPPEDTGLDAR